MSTILPITRENLSQLGEVEGALIPLFKERGYSSGFFVNQIRKRLSRLRKVKRFKVGHTGTLDPFAEGVLGVLVGKATKSQSEFMHLEKEYLATLRFGATTPTLDPDSAIVEEDKAFTLDRSDLERVIPEFMGAIEQVPPIYSAKHVDGKRAYELARKGETPELKPVSVKVVSISLIRCTENEAELRVRCGSGVYVRSLARDIAASLGTIGYLTKLIRSEAAGIKLDQCLRLREVLSLGQESSAIPDRKELEKPMVLEECGPDKGEVPNA